MRTTLLLLFLSFTAGVILAQRVPIEIASRVADNYHIQSKRDLGFDSEPVELDLVHTESIDNSPAYYVFNSEDNQGFVLVSGNYSCYPVVGFSPDGSFNPDLMPPALEDLLGRYEIRISEISRKKSTNNEYLHLWEKYSGNSAKKSTAAEDTVVSVGPLLRSNWAQGCYYNSLCPEDPDGPCDNVLVGCVAIAIGQIMNYYQYPEKGYSSKSYHHDTYGLIGASFAKTEYQWKNMPDKLMADNNDLAKFLFHCAVASEMNFSPTGSGAYTFVATEGMKEYFNYSDDLEYIYNDTSEISARDYREEIWNELDNFRPVLGDGPPPAYGNVHAYVIDGYLGTDLLHYNWGWGGSADGYYRIGAEFIHVGIQPKPCEGDTLRPKMVEDLSYIVDKDSVIVTWNIPQAEDGDYASKYNLIRDNKHDFFIYDSLYKFRWDTMGTYNIKLKAYDDCMHPADNFAELNVILTDTMNYSPRIVSSAPSNRKIIPLYQGVYKFFEVESSDPNGDTLSYSWSFNGNPIPGETSPRLALNVQGIEPGLYPLRVHISDRDLTRQNQWLIKIPPGDSTVIDNLDSLRFEGNWYKTVNPGGYEGGYHFVKRNVYFPPTAEYIYFPQRTGTYELSVFVPFLRDLSQNALYIVMENDVPLDTIQLDQRSSSDSWVDMGLVDLTASTEFNLKVINTDMISFKSYMVIDAIKLKYLGQGDFLPPVLISGDSLLQPEFINAISSEDGIIYLVPENTGRDMELVQNACLDSVQAFASIKAQLSVPGLQNGEYWLYARDSAMNLSEPEIVTVIGVGIPKLEYEQVRIYPVPTIRSLIVEADFPGKYSISILTINGQMVRYYDTEDPLFEIDLSAIPEGVYFITINSKDYSVTRKIIRL